MKKLWMTLGILLFSNVSYLRAMEGEDSDDMIEYPLNESINELSKRLKTQKDFSYLNRGKSLFSFRDKTEAKKYYEQLLEAMWESFQLWRETNSYYLPEDREPGYYFSTENIERTVITKMTEDGIVMSFQDFHVENEDGTRIVHSEAAALLGLLKNIATQIVPTREKLEKEIQAKNEQEKNQIIAHKMRDLFKPLEDHIIAQHEAAKPKPHWSSGWKGHVLTATVAGVATLGAVYGALKLSNMKLTPAAV